MFKKAAVIGAGFMGGSIALLCAQNGIETINIDVSQKQIEKAKVSAQKNLAKLTEKGKISGEEAKRIIGRLSYSADIQDIKRADIAIEAVPEDIELKKSIIGQIEEQAGKDAIILSNTSSLSITQIAKHASCPERIMGAHFFSPPTVMKLIELIRGKRTSDDTYRKTKQFAEQINKEAVDTPELPGFIVNRLLIPLINEAAFLLMQGAKKEDIDKAMKLGANHIMGPLELGDYVGLDVVLAIMQNMHDGFGGSKHEPCPLIIEMVSKRHLGRKTKQGFYKY